MEFQTPSPMKTPIKGKTLIPDNLLPYKILDAPDLSDNFYHNVLSWSSLNVILLSLKNTIYLYNPEDNQVD
jgi:hypothetical protein